MPDPALAALTWAYWSGLAASLAAAGLHGAGLTRAGRLAGLLALACLLAGMGLFLAAAGRPPLYGSLEASLQIGLILALLATLDIQGGGDRYRGAWLPWALAGGFLGLGACLPLQPGYDFYMYADPRVIGFFQLRLTALGLAAYAGSRLAAHALWLQPGYARGRGFLLLAATTYLGGELSGCLWSQDWMGDYWRWYAGFFESSLAFLILMAVFHLPLAWVTPRRRAAMGSLAALWVLVMLLWHQWSQSA